MANLPFLAHATLKDKLPEDVQPIMAYNAMQWIGAYRKASTEMLLERLGFANK